MAWRLLLAALSPAGAPVYVCNAAPHICKVIILSPVEPLVEQIEKSL